MATLTSSPTKVGDKSRTPVRRKKKLPNTEQAPVHPPEAVAEAGRFDTTLSPVADKARTEAVPAETSAAPVPVVPAAAVVAPAPEPLPALAPAPAPATPSAALEPNMLVPAPVSASASGWTGSGQLLLGGLGMAALAGGGGGQNSSPAPVPPDTTAPAVTVTVTVTDNAAGPVTFTVKFSEAVTGFDASKLSLSGGSLSALTKVSDSEYTVVATPATTATGTLQLSVNTSGVTDAAGNTAVAPAVASQAYAQNVLQGSIVAGPVVGTHQLSVKVFNAAGQAIANAMVDASGYYKVALGSYIGPVSVLVVDADNTQPDYVDEVSKEPVDLSGNLLVAGSVGEGNTVQTLNINPITTVAALKAGVQVAADGASLQTGTVLDAPKISTANAAVAKALLGSSATAAYLLTATIVPTVNADRTTNASANTYGKVLAALAGMDTVNGGDASKTLSALVAGISDSGTLSSGAQTSLTQGAGAAGVPASELPSSSGGGGATNSAATGSAALSGTAEEGGTLTANTSGILDPDGTALTFSYQWQMADAANGSYTNISNATSSSFSIAADQSLLGKFLRVVVTATNDGTASGTSFASSPSAAVGDTTPPDAVDLSANPGVQSTADVAFNRREWIDSKAILTGLQTPTATDIAEVRLVLSENWQTQEGVDQLVLNTVRSLNADFSAQNITLERITGWRYFYTVSNRTLVLSKHDGPTIQADQLVEALGAIAFKSSSDSMLARAVNVSYVDPSGNAGASGTVRLSLSEPLVQPGPSVTVTDDMSGVATAPFVLRFSFDRDVFGFDAQDVAISNATKGLFTALTAREYTLAVTPRANSSGTIQLFLNTTGYADESGYQTTGVVQHTQAFDTRKPVLTITDPVSSVAAQAIVFSFSFSEAVTGFDASDIQVDGGMAGTFTAVSSTLYTLLIAPPAVPGKGSISLSVAANAATDLPGNALASSVTHVQAYDTTLPEVASLTSNTATLKAGEVATVSVVFSKPVTGLSLSDWVVTNGELSNLRTLDGGLSWTAMLTPSPLMDLATARVAFIGDFADTAGRFVNAVAADNPHAELSFTLDTTRPRLLSMTLSDSLLYANETATVSLIFSETVSGLSLSDFSAGSAVLSDLTSDAQGIRWTMKLTPSFDTRLPGQQLQLTGNPTDAFGNALQHATEPAFGVDFWTYAVNTQERDPDYTITGARVGDYSGASVGWAGNAWAADANDAKQGVLIGSPNWRSSDEAEWAEGAVHGLHGRTATSDLDLSALAPMDGRAWTLGEAEAALGWKTLRVGDVNGDGRQDLALAAPYADAGVGADAGQVWVLLQSGASLADVAAGTGGWAMQGLAEGDALGWSVAAAGDVDGDGYDDVLMAAPYADASADALDAGQVMLVRGRADGTAGASTVWSSPNAGDWLGFAVAGGGDINGDGLADVLLAAPDADVVVGSDTLTDAGQVYVVYGSRTGMASLADVRSGTGGRLINGFAEGQSLGHAVAVVGDMNGDGYADMVVGAPDHASARGGAWLVWGGTDDTALDLGNPGHRAVYLFNGQDDVAQLGYAVAAAGDFNADGFADLVLAAPGTDGPAGAQSGAAYVVFGKATARWGASLDVTELRLGDGSGLVYHGQAAGDGAAGMALAGGGDVNGDGLSDLLVGFAAAVGTRGVTQVLLGAPTYFNSISILGTSGDDALGMSESGAEITLAGDGNDTLYGMGSDVLLGGAGNDHFMVDSNWTLSLNKPGDSGLWAGLDGGAGVDTVSLVGSDFRWDLTSIPDIQGRLKGLEVLDMSGMNTDTESQTVRIGVREVLAIGAVNVFNSANGWDGLGSMVQKHQILVQGTSLDTVELGDSENWQLNADIVFQEQAMHVFHHATSAAQLLVSAGVHVVM